MEIYGLKYPDSPAGALAAEKYAIRAGGKWMDRNGKPQGNGLLFHYLAFRKIVWPERYCHAWTELIYSQIIQNAGTVLLGSASSQKTSHASEWVLIDYWCFPENTCVLVSTTTVDKLESAVFGEIKKLWSIGQKKFSWLAGNLIDSKHWIVTDDIDAKDFDGDDDGRKVARDVRKGILGKACYSGKQNVGLGGFAGIKQERFRWLCDEMQFMESTLSNALPNMRSNTGAGGFKFIGSGNPNHEPTAQLTILAEPKGGWAEVEDNEETSVWETNYYGFKCVNLIGTDSPNFHARLENPALKKDPYYRLIGPEFAAIIEHDYGRNSPEWETQIMGRMKLALAQARVITREMCRTHRAHETAIWKGTPTTKIHCLDPAYGPGDRCTQGHVEFGEDINGDIILKIHPITIIRIDLRKKDESAEDQIAQAVKQYLAAHGIPAENSFYDSTGKGTVGFAFARHFGANPPNPIDSGGPTTERMVREDLYVVDANGARRHKTCREHYSKFVTEMWFSVRYAIEAKQIRDLPNDVMMEGCSRIYETVGGNKIEVETKAEMRKTLGKSSDLFDCVAIAVEGARQRGFRIARLGNDVAGKGNGLKEWFLEQREKNQKYLSRSNFLSS